MKKVNMKPTVTGLAAGMLAGTAAYMLFNRPVKSQAKKLKSSAGRAMRNVGVALEGMSEFLG